MKPTSFFDDNLSKTQSKIWTSIDHQNKKLVDIKHIMLFNQFFKRSKTPRRSKSIIYVLNEEGLYQVKPDQHILTSFLDLTCVKIDFFTNQNMEQAQLIERQFNKKDQSINGFRFSHNNKYLDIFTSDQNQWNNWKSFLIYRCIQSNFHEEYQVSKMIGKGSFAKVYQATKRSHEDRKYAIKVFNKEFISSQTKGKESLINEISIMRQLKSDYLLRLYEIYESTNSIYFVLDIINGGELLHRIREKGQINQYELVTLMRNIMKAIHYLHQRNIMHRDLKPENLLLKSKESDGYDIVLADFGLAAKCSNPNILFRRCGTPGFVAPEVLQYKDGDPLYGVQCDIFSVGVIFFLLLTGKQPFQGTDYKQIINQNKLCQIDYKIPELKCVSKQTLDLLQKMLDPNPQTRLTAQQVLKHEFLFKEDDHKASIDVPCNSNIGQYESEFMAIIKNKQMTVSEDCSGSIGLVQTSRLAINGLDDTILSEESVDSIQMEEDEIESRKVQEKIEEQGERKKEQSIIEIGVILAKQLEQQALNLKRSNQIKTNLFKEIWENNMRNNIDQAKISDSCLSKKFKLDVQIDNFSQDWKDKSSPEGFGEQIGKLPSKIQKLQ